MQYSTVLQGARQQGSGVLLQNRKKNGHEEEWRAKSFKDNRIGSGAWPGVPDEITGICLQEHALLCLLRVALGPKTGIQTTL
jgi:hypothetical protein